MPDDDNRRQVDVEWLKRDLTRLEDMIRRLDCRTGDHDVLAARIALLEKIIFALCGLLLAGVAGAIMKLILK